MQAYPGEVPARPRKRGNEAQANGIGDPGKHNRGRLGCNLGRPRRRCANGEDHVRLKADQLGGEVRKDLIFSFRVTPLESDVLSFDVAESPQSFRECLEGFRRH